MYLKNSERKTRRTKIEISNDKRYNEYVKMYCTKGKKQKSHWACNMYATWFDMLTNTENTVNAHCLV